jgi:Right handed beta helix region
LVGGALALALVIAIAGAAWLTATSSPRTTHATSPVTSAPPQSTEKQSASGAAVAASSAPATPAGPAAALATDHVRVCGNGSILGRGPSSAPAGAVSVPAGNDSHVNWKRPNTTYWFAPGIHTLGPGRYTQIQPGAGSTFIGAPGAVLSGQQVNYYAFAGNATNVTISYLTIKNFGTRGGNFNQGAVNVSSASDWTIDHTTVEDNAGAGVMLGSGDRLLYDCLLKNQQYGFNAYSVPGPSHLTMDDNEIAENDTYNWEKHSPGCGCTGGGKFWDVNGANVEDNWVHGNHSVGMWADTNNQGFNFTGNYFEDNYSEALIYEISYNAQIKDNLFTGNAIGLGPSSPGFPTAAIYISESGSDSRVATNYNQSFEITGNTFIDNWSGVILWENSNRYCGSPDNSSSGTCTLIDPAVANIRSCSRSHLQHATARRTPDYYDLCRWKTQNVQVDHNVFDFNPAAIGHGCTAAHGCGYVGVFSEYGSDPSWSPYHGTAVEYHITFGQGNHFAANVYSGPWRFMALADGETVSWSSWRSRYREDGNSELRPDVP